MFLHMSVTLFTVGGLQAHTQGEVGGLVGGPQAHTQGEVEGSGQRGLQAHTQGGGWGSGQEGSPDPGPGRSRPRQGVYPSMHWGSPPLQQMATAVESMHPTGMHSCCICSQIARNLKKNGLWYRHNSSRDSMMNNRLNDQVIRVKMSFTFLWHTMYIDRAVHKSMSLRTMRTHPPPRQNKPLYLTGLVNQQ